MPVTGLPPTGQVPLGTLYKFRWINSSTNSSARVSGEATGKTSDCSGGAAENKRARIRGRPEALATTAVNETLNSIRRLLKKMPDGPAASDKTAC
jgi:hypothetical protein